MLPDSHTAPSRSTVADDRGYTPRDDDDLRLLQLYLLAVLCIQHQTRILAVQRFGVGLVIERSLVRLTAGALSSQLGQLSLPSIRGR